MLVITQWRQYANFGSSGVGASGSMRKNVKDCAEAESEVAEKVILGVSFTSLTRTSEPLVGDLEGNETWRSYVGLKFAEMIGEG